MAEDGMELEPPEKETTQPEKETTQPEKSDVGNAEYILDHLITCKDVFYKSQQRGEKDFCPEEKREIAAKIFLKSKANFLSRFGKHLGEEHLSYFQQYTDDAIEGYDILFYLNNFRKNIKMKKNEVKNRRFSALTQLVDEKSYFSETEMMRRNPLLYDQLVGQYLSEDERKERDNLDTKNITFVNLLLEGIDRDYVKMKKKQQQEDEDNAMEEEEDDDDKSEEEEEEMIQDNIDDGWIEEKPSTSKWGEYEDDKNTPSNSQNYTPFSRLSQRDNIPAPSKNILMITATERRLLKEEFTSIMYQNFLDGKDADFDYESVDNNEEYDNLNIKTHDAEDKYFDSESPENVTPGERKMSTDTSEDELDVFMNRLNQQQAIKKLTQDISNL